MRQLETFLEDFRDEVRAWPGMSAHPHRFGGTEFRIGRAEVGHLHEHGTLDIPYPRSVRDELLAQGLAEQHHWVPDSGWSTFHIRAEGDVRHATWLLRLSYLHYVLKVAPNAHELLRQEAEHWQLKPPIRSLFEQLLPRNARKLSQGEISVVTISKGENSL
jgi:Family of unknown function (DUF5519)